MHLNYYGVQNIPPESFPDATIDIEVFDRYEEVTETRDEIVGYTDEPRPLYIQCGANSGQGMFIDRYDCRPQALYKEVFDPETITLHFSGAPTSVTLTKLVTKPWQEATASLIALDVAFGKVNEYRARAGAQQNRLEFVDNSLGISLVNLEDANSRIADADMAKEMMNLTKANVLQQAGA